MAEAFESDIEYDFEYDGHPYRFEPEYANEEILERRKQRLAVEQRAIEQATARPRKDNKW